MRNNDILEKINIISLKITSIAFIISSFIGNNKVLTVAIVAWVISTISNVITIKGFKYAVNVIRGTEDAHYKGVKKRIFDYIVITVVALGIILAFIDLCYMVSVAF